MSDQSVKRQLGGMPTGEYRMADMQFSVREIKPPKPQEEPSTIPEYELWDGDYAGITVCAQPFRELEEAVNKMIRLGKLYDGSKGAVPSSWFKPARGIFERVPVTSGANKSLSDCPTCWETPCACRDQGDDDWLRK